MDKPQRQRERRSRRNKEAEENDERGGEGRESIPEKEKASDNNRGKRRGPYLIQTKNISIPSRFIGLLIGPRGANIYALQQRTHCRVMIAEAITRDIDENEETSENNRYSNYHDDAESRNNNNNNNNKSSTIVTNKDKDKDKDNDLREISLIGSPEEIDACEKEINFVVKNNRFMLDKERGMTGTKKSENEIAEVMRVPSKVCGMLIGMGGKKISEIQLLTGAEIFVEFDEHQHVEAGVSTVTIKGHKKSVEMAKEEIRRILELFGGAGGKGAQEYVFEIPSQYSKQIIGIKGETVRQLQGTYGVTISIKKYKNSDSSLFHDNTIQKTDIVQLIGEQENMYAAKQAIDELLGGTFIKCNQCHKLVLEKDGKEEQPVMDNEMDQYQSQYQSHHKKKWYCNYCWKEWARLNGADIPNIDSNYNTEPNYYEFNENNTNWNEIENYPEMNNYVEEKIETKERIGKEQKRYNNEERDPSSYETQSYYTNYPSTRYSNFERQNQNIENDVQKGSYELKQEERYNNSAYHRNPTYNNSSYYYPPSSSSSTTTTTAPSTTTTKITTTATTTTMLSNPTFPSSSSSYEKKSSIPPSIAPTQRQFNYLEKEVLPQLTNLSLNTQQMTNTNTNTINTINTTNTTTSTVIKNNNNNNNNNNNYTITTSSQSQSSSQLQKRVLPIGVRSSTQLTGNPSISENINTAINTNTNINNTKVKAPAKPPRGRGNFQGF